LKFTTVTHALLYYYRRRRELSSTQSPPLEPREIDRPGRTDTLEEKLAECMTVGVHTKYLTRLERFVLDALYDDGLSMNELVLRLKWADRHFFTFPWRTRAPRGGKRTDHEYLTDIRHEAERKIEKRLDEKGLLG